MLSYEQMMSESREKTDTTYGDGQKKDKTRIEDSQLHSDDLFVDKQILK